MTALGVNTIANVEPAAYGPREAILRRVLHSWDVHSAVTVCGPSTFVKRAVANVTQKSKRLRKVNRVRQVKRLGIGGASSEILNHSRHVGRTCRSAVVRAVQRIGTR
jgi:hypothetical protein